MAIKCGEADRGIRAGSWPTSGLFSNRSVPAEEAGQVGRAVEAGLEVP